MNNKEKEQDIIDKDLIEDISDEEMYELVQEARQAVLQKEKSEKQRKQRKPFPKWLFWLIALAMVFNVISLLPQTFSIPAIDFLITSAKLSTDEQIKTYKKSVVVIETEDSKGTGFSIHKNGTILTNYHVVEGEDEVTVAFPDDGLHHAKVVATDSAVDLALLKVEKEEEFPFLNLAEQYQFQENEQIQFIGNPLQFQGIANEGEVLEPIKLSTWEEEVIMIEAPVYRGNSGSPILNEQGLVVGVVFGTLRHETYGRVGLFVPIDNYYSTLEADDES